MIRYDKVRISEVLLSHHIIQLKGRHALIHTMQRTVQRVNNQDKITFPSSKNKKNYESGAHSLTLNFKLQTFKPKTKNPLSPFLPCFTTANEGKGGPDSMLKQSLTTIFHCKGTGTVLRPINGNVNVNVNVNIYIYHCQRAQCK
jgi:hypothetical protein